MGRPGQINLKLERKQWHPTPVPLPRKSHGWRSLVGCSPWALEESDMTEWLHLLFPLSWIGEGNGNPLRCSCLENPRDSGAWWAAIYGVTQSWTRLKWLSSSSSSSRWKSCQIHSIKIPFFLDIKVNVQCISFFLAFILFLSILKTK